MFSNRKSRRAGQVRPNRGGFEAMVEVFEKRELLTGIGPFIQGTAFVDAAGTGSLTGGDAPVAGATISLYQGTTVSASTYLESTTTNANGQYLFDNNGQGNGDGIAAPVAGQTYTVVETAVPSGYASKGTQTISELDPVVGTTSNSITVTIAPSEVQTTYNGINSFSNILYFSLDGTQQSAFGSSLNFQVSSASGSVNTSSFQSYCVDPSDTLNTPPETYTTATDPTTSLANGGEIGYLFNQYGITPPTASSLPSSIQSIKGYTTGDVEAGLQAAIWTLEFPGEFSIENIPGGMTTDYAIVSAIASDFIADAQANPPEQVGILDASLSGSLPSASATANAQSVLVGESLNFANTQVETGSISGTDLLVSNSNTSANGLTTSTPNSTINGTTVDLLNAGGSVIATTTTSGNGAYSFTGLPVGTTYSVVEVPPASDNHLGQTSSTTGAVTNSGSTVSSISLTASSPTSVDNFFETASVSVNGSDYLVPSTTSLTTSTTGTPLAGTTITLTGTDEFGNAVSKTTTTASNGSYSFNGLNPSTTGYTVTETLPASYAHLGQTSTLGTVSSTPSVSSIVLVPNGSSSTENFFEYGAQISGTVYADNNVNDTFDNGDSGIGGVTVYLYNGSGSVQIATTTTASNGTYSFSNLNLPAGTYIVSEIPPSGYTGETPNPGVSGGTGTFLASNNLELITAIPLGAGVSDTGNNLAQYKASSISGTVYADNNINDTLDGGDTGIGGVTVYLYSGSSTTPTASTTTAANGTYSFGNLAPGSYLVSEFVPNGDLGETPNPGVSGGSPAFVSKSNLEQISAIPLASGTNDTGNNFGQYSAGSLSGVVFVDATNSGSFVGTDATLSGISVSLVNSVGTTIATTQTGSGGAYSFTGLVPGTYTVVEGTVSGYSPDVTNNGSISSIRVTAGANTPNNNFGEIQPGTISGTVYADNNANDVLDGGDTGIGGVQVFLYNSTGTSRLATTTTASDGTYSFTGVAPGTYIVAEFAPSGYTGETPNPGVSGGTPSYSTSSTLATINAIPLTSGTNDTGNNFGELGQSSISGTVYVDATGQGLNSSNQPAGAGDTGEAGVTVTLTESNGTKLTTTTASNGTYSFTGLPFGTYGISESIPSGTYQTGPNSVTYTVTTSAGSPSSTNDNFSNYMACNMSGLDSYYFTITTPSGASTNVTNLGGNVAPGDTVTAYFNIAPGSAPEMLSLVAYQAPTSSYSPSNAYEQVITSVATGTYGPGNYSETVTIPNSYFQVDFVCGAALPNLELNNHLVDYQYENRLISAANGGTQAYALSTLSGTVYADNNGNDTLDTGDSGIGGVTLYLYNGTTPIASTTTASNGSYSFTNLPLGSYNIYESTVSGYTAEPSNVGSNGGTSGTQALTSITLNSNTNATGYNFGELLPVASISGTVYNDANRNDTLDSGDTGIGGVQVFLYNSTGTTRLATTTTASNGTYSFTGIAPGTYIVAEFAPSGETGETPNAGISGGTPSYSTSSTLATINAITLTSGTNDTGNNFGNLPPLTGTACLNGIVYADINYNDVYNSGIDYGIAGVTVTLSGKTVYGSAYTLTTTTNSNGVYTFTNVVAGNYTITETEPAGYTAEASNVGNAGGVIGLGSTSSVSVTSGATDTGYNFGSKVNNCSLGNYQTCSTNWWCGSNGQSLINCMNGSSSSTKLGNWLSSMLPNICGSFAGKTNSQVCSSFQSLCLTNSCDAQIVSTALAAYCTNTSLAGCSTAANYGFGLVTGGSGNCTVNLGSTFAGYGGPCNTTSLFQLLSFADSQSTTWNSWWNFGWSSSSQSSISSWFSSINSCSKIG